MDLYNPGSCIGMEASWALRRRKPPLNQDCSQCWVSVVYIYRLLLIINASNTPQHSVNEGGLRSPGTLFLWMFWPSFNSVLVDVNPPGRKLGAVLGTYLALAASAVTAAAVSVLSSPEGKLNLVHFETY